MISNKEKADKMRALVSILIREEMEKGDLQSMMRAIIFSHEDDSFWINQVPAIIREWMPDYELEVRQIIKQ